MGQGYKLNSALVLSTASTGLGGLDTGSLAANTLYYVYAAVSSNTVGLVASLNAPSTGPTGFTQWRQIGRMRTFSGSAALAIVVNNFLGNGGPAEAQEVTEWVSWTPTITGNVTNPTKGTATETARWRRVGSKIEVMYSYIQTLAGNAGNGSYSISLPNGYAIDYAQLSSGNTNLGPVYAYNGTTEYIGYTNASATSAVYFLIFTSIGSTYALGSANVSLGNAAARIQTTFSVPIVEFAGLFS